jgi:hypothetical protein
MALRTLGFCILLFSILTPLSWAAKPKASKQTLLKRTRSLEAMTSQKLGRDKRALDAWLKTKDGTMPRVTPRLLKAYYFLGATYAQLYVHHADDEEPKRVELYYRRARYYLDAAIAYEHEIDKAERNMEVITRVRSDRARAVDTTKWRALFQYMSYQELALLKDAAGEEKIYSPQRGFCAGIQWAYGNLESEWTFDACAYISSGNVGAENTNRYFQDNVSTKGFFFKPTYWKLLSDGEAALGFGLPVMLRTVDYTEPPNTTVESRRAVPFGFSVDGRFHVTQKTYLTTTTAMVDGSLLWSFGGLYEL